MNNISSWEAQTKELIDRTDREIGDFKAEAETHVAMLQQRKWALEESLRAYRDMMGSEATRVAFSLSQKDVKDKSYREILHLIAKRNNGLLIARKAITLMKLLDVFANPLNADSVVYSVLSRSQDFIKVGKGVYKLNGYDATSVAHLAKARKGGVKQAVKELKEKNPQMTKRQVKNYLTRHGFDFQGKNPGQAVHMAWVNLGYAQQEKETRQASLIQ